MKETALVVPSAFVSFSCSKLEKDESRAYTINTTALAGPYKIKAMGYKATASPAGQDLNDILDEPCRRDDIYTFNINNTYKLKDAGTVCSPSGEWNMDLIGKYDDERRRCACHCKFRWQNFSAC